jgi:cellulose 1,4-beta-cellobiosidase
VHTTKEALALAAALLTAGGILAVLPAASSGAATTTLCRSQTLPIAGGYTIQNNEWGSSAPECITTGGNTGFTVANSSIANSASGAPGGYPSIYQGCHWGACTSGSGFPIQVSKIRAGAVTTSWSTSQPGGGSDYDVAYDIWFNQTPATSGQPNGTELMIWLNHNGPVQPYGSRVASNVRIGGRRYSVWFGTQAWKTVSYTMTSGTTAVSHLDLRALVADAVSRGYINPSWYLIDVEAGFELWQGGAGLATNSFSVHVAGGGTPSPIPTPTTPSPTPTPSPASTLSISLQAISPDPTKQGTATNATVDFRNTGSTAASGVTLVTEVRNSAGTVVGSQSRAGQNVAPQQILNETCTWTAASSAGSYTVEGLVQDSRGKTLQHAQVGTITVK